MSKLAKVGKKPLKAASYSWLFIASTMFTCCIMHCIHDGIQNSCPGHQHSTDLVCGLTWSSVALPNSSAIGQAIRVLVKQHVMSEKITFSRSGKLKSLSNWHVYVIKLLSKAFSCQKYNKPGKSICVSRCEKWDWKRGKSKMYGKWFIVLGKQILQATCTSPNDK